MNRVLVLITSICLSLFLMACGGGGGADTSFIPVATVQASQKVSNSSLLDIYNTISVGYTTTSATAKQNVFITDVVFNIDGYKTAAPQIFVEEPIRMINYNFPDGNAGVGSLTIVTSGPGANAFNVDYVTEPQGSIALYSISSTQAPTPVIGVQMKGVQAGVGNLLASQFVGKWGFVTLTTQGLAKAAELDFNADGTVTGVGFESSTSGVVSANLLNVVTDTYSVNANRDKLVFAGSTWFVNPDLDLAISGQGPGVSADRISVLLKPSSIGTIDGRYEIFQWSAFSGSNTTAAGALGITSMPLSTVVNRGSINFTGGTAVMTDILGVGQQNSPFQIHNGTQFMWQFTALEQNLADRDRIRFFVSADKTFFVGAEYDNDVDAKTSLLLGVKRSP